VSVPGARAAAPRRITAKSVLTWTITIAVAIVVVVVANHHAHEVLETLRNVSPIPVLGAAALHGVTLALRSEAWRIGLRAVGADALPMRSIHRANGLAFLVGTIQGELSLPARVAALRRSEPDRAPTAVQTAMVDAPLALVELAWLFALAAFWRPELLLGTVVIVIALPLVARRVAPRRPAGSALRGLMVASDRAALGRLAVVMGAVVLVSAARIWLILVAFDLPVDVASVAKVIAAVTVIGTLPFGLSTGPAATIASLSSGQAALTTDGVAISAGLAISATSVLGVLAYAAVVWAPAAVERLRRAPTP
jgi:uncharacterized membrane protein YbhN (UPF0104 family)